MGNYITSKLASKADYSAEFPWLSIGRPPIIETSFDAPDNILLKGQYVMKTEQV